MAGSNSLKKSLKENSPLVDLVELGLGAFLNVDTKLVAESQRPRVGDSLNLDAATKEELPQENRWDYILSIPDIKKIVGIEPHSAKDNQVSVVVKKRKNAVEYLRGHLQDGIRVSTWYWVCHGRVSFSKTERARRILLQNGIKFEGRVLRSFG